MTKLSTFTNARFNFQTLKMGNRCHIIRLWYSKLIYKNFSGSDQSFPPSFRMHRNYSFPVHSRGHGHNNGHRKDRKRTRLLNQLKKGAGVIKSSLPKIKDVNVIDKYSRVVFPVSFILFNVAYWCFYVIDDPESSS